MPNVLPSEQTRRVLGADEQQPSDVVVSTRSSQIRHPSAVEALWETRSTKPRFGRWGELRVQPEETILKLRVASERLGQPARLRHGLLILRCGL
jgi:hypothetical protein